MAAFRAVVRAASGGAVLLIAVALQQWGAEETRLNRSEVIGLTICGAGWLWVMSRAFEWSGIYVAFGCAWLVPLGAWKGMPR